MLRKQYELQIAERAKIPSSKILNFHIRGIAYFSSTKPKVVDQTSPYAMIFLRDHNNIYKSSAVPCVYVLGEHIVSAQSIENAILCIISKTKFESYKVTKGRYVIDFNEFTYDFIMRLLDFIFSCKHKINYSWVAPLQDLLFKLEDEQTAQLGKLANKKISTKTKIKHLTKKAPSLRTNISATPPLGGSMTGTISSYLMDSLAGRVVTSNPYVKDLNYLKSTVLGIKEKIDKSISEKEQYVNDMIKKEYVAFRESTPDKNPSPEEDFKLGKYGRRSVPLLEIQLCDFFEESDIPAEPKHSIPTLPI